MADPIVEQIMKKIVTALETITTANGYAVEVGSGGVWRPKTVEDVDKPGFTQTHWAQLVEDDPTRNEEYSITNNPARIAWNQPVIIDLVYRPDTESTAPIFQQIAIFNAEAQIALFGTTADADGRTLPDDNAQNQWGGLALDTEDIDAELFVDEENNFVGWQKIIMVKYRHKETTPYEQ